MCEGPMTDEEMVRHEVLAELMGSARRRWPTAWDARERFGVVAMGTGQCGRVNATVVVKAGCLHVEIRDDAGETLNDGIALTVDLALKMVARYLDKVPVCV